MDLGQYLEEFKYNTFFLPKGVQKRLAAALPGAIAAQDSGLARAGAGVQAALIGKAGQENVAGMKEKGTTHREMLRNAANEMLERMRQSGTTTRTGMSIKGGLDLEHEKYLTGIANMQEENRLNKGLLQDYPELTKRGGNSITAEAIQDAVDRSLGIDREKERADTAASIAAENAEREKRRKQRQLAEEVGARNPLSYEMPF